MEIINAIRYSVVPFVAMLLVLVVVHELGHFVTAKLAGVQVLEFGLGYPPKIWGIRFGEKRTSTIKTSKGREVIDERTEYTINLLPLGGFVRLLGEEDSSDPRSLAAKPNWVRIVVLSAGAFMNLVLPIVLFTAFFMIPQQVPIGRALVQAVAPDSPAHQADVQSGDQILRINSKSVENLNDVAYDIRLYQGQTMTWQIKRGRNTLTKQVYARWNPPEIVDPQTGQRVREGPTGIELTTPDRFTQRQSFPIWQAIPRATQYTWETLVLTRNQIVTWVASRTTPQVAGPVGIAQVTGEVTKQSGWTGFLQFAALLSINLGIINILPLPMLDGGRIMFVLLEVLRGGKRIAPEKEAMVHFVGLVVLLSLVVVISYFDVVRIIHGGSLLR